MGQAAITNMGQAVPPTPPWGEGALQNMVGGLIQYMGEHGGYQRKGKSLVNNGTVACRLNNVILLLS